MGSRRPAAPADDRHRPGVHPGRLAEQRSRLLALLQAEGLLARNRAHPVPALPLRIALVTSAGSAAHADFTHELERSGFAFEVRTIDGMQGLQAAASIGNALARPGRGRSTWSRSCAAEAPPPTSSPSTASRWPVPSPAAPSPCSRASATRSTTPWPTTSVTPRRRPPPPVRASWSRSSTRPTGSSRPAGSTWRRSGARLDRHGKALQRAATGLVRDAAVTLRAADRRSALAGERLPRLATAATVGPAAALDARAARVSREARRHLHDHERTVLDAVRTLREAPARTLRTATRS